MVQTLNNSASKQDWFMLQFAEFRAIGGTQRTCSLWVSVLDAADAKAEAGQVEEGIEGIA